MMAFTAISWNAKIYRVLSTTKNYNMKVYWISSLSHISSSYILITILISKNCKWTRAYNLQGDAKKAIQTGKNICQTNQFCFQIKTSDAQICFTKLYCLGSDCVLYKALKREGLAKYSYSFIGPVWPKHGILGHLWAFFFGKWNAKFWGLKISYSKMAFLAWTTCVPHFLLGKTKSILQKPPFKSRRWIAASGQWSSGLVLCRFHWLVPFVKN